MGENGHVAEARRIGRSIMRIESVAENMRAQASALEASAQGAADMPLACEAYSECVAILRDGADRLLKPIPAVD